MQDQRQLLQLTGSCSYYKDIFLIFKSFYKYFNLNKGAQHVSFCWDSDPIQKRLTITDINFQVWLKQKKLANDKFNKDKSGGNY